MQELIHQATRSKSHEYIWPYVDELMIPQLKAIVEKYDIDFVWVDGECWGAELDYPGMLHAWKRRQGCVIRQNPVRSALGREGLQPETV